MKLRYLLFALLIVSFEAPRASALTVGQIDTFEDGTTQGWFAGLGLMGIHPAPPVNALGGPAGASDNYLHLTALGGGGPGGRLSVVNLAQWAGNFISAGITSIAMDMINLGNTDLSLRLVFEDPTAVAPPTNIAFSQDAFFLPAGSGWMHAVFSTSVSDLQAGLGSINDALTNTTAIRLYHSPAANFPNPISPITSVVAALGVDNIQAQGASVPDGSSTAIMLLPVLLTAGYINRRVRKSADRT